MYFLTKKWSHYMKNLKYFFIMIFFFSFFSIHNSAQSMKSNENVKQELEKAKTNFMDGFKEGNAKKMAQGYTLDARALPPNAPEAKGKEAITKLWQGLIDLGKGTVKVGTVSTDIAGNFAIEHHTYQLEIKMKNGNLYKDSGKSLVVYKKQNDGHWLIKTEIWNSDLPVPDNQKD
jgi:ketosteroid isomerase-like protein